jgi:hypothetical protein
MKKIINEELNYIKYLFEYKKGVVVSEQETTTTSTTIQPSTDPQKSEEPIQKKEKEGEKDPKKIIEELTNQICTEKNNKCKPCGHMLKDLEIGKLKEKVIERCLTCGEKKGADYLECDKIKGQLMAMSGKVGTQKDTVHGQASVWVMLGSSLLSLGTQIKTLFKKEPNY